MLKMTDHEKLDELEKFLEYLKTLEEPMLFNAPFSMAVKGIDNILRS
jgi:hypothetical protein